MMGAINVLDKSVAELIAAGEVIERPASIVKELLENSIDAKATIITVEIKRGGISYIRISDNGTGIEKEDLPKAFLRHATSKIKLSDDLDNISTLGFRGEALASVAAVSRVCLTSKTKEADFGSSITLEGGEAVDFSDAGCPNGTTITVKDLFYNVPARLKFLKKDTSEANAIAGIVEKIALSHPEISFKLISDGKIKLHTPGNNDLLSAIHSVFGREFASALLPVDYSYNGISVKGYVSNTRTSRVNRSMQHFFVNSRYVKSKTCFVALEEAYKNSIMVGKYPFCILNLSVPYSSIDVNVHPAKIEIRFINERQIFDTMYFAVKSALTNDDLLKPKEAASPKPQVDTRNLLSTFKTEEAEQITISETQKEQQKRPVKEYSFTENKAPVIAFNSNEAKYQKDELPPKQDKKAQVVTEKKETVFTIESPKEEMKEVKIEESFNFISKEMLNKKIEPEIKKEETPVEPKTEFVPFKSELNVKIIGELFRTYLLFEVNDSLLLMDKHAAHERIIFEELKKSVKTDERQILLKPLVVSVSTEEFDALSNNKELLKDLGFLYDEFGTNAFIIREVPLVLTKYDIADIFVDLANKIASNKREITSDSYENLLHSMACRSAIKAHDNTSVEELRELLIHVYENDEIRHCPHGRPVVISMTKYEIEKQFGRLQ